LNLASPVPLYVIQKNAAENTLVVGPAEALGASELLALNVNWTGGEVPTGPFRAMVKSRYTAREAPGLVTPLDHGTQVSVRFDLPQRDITAGQAAVFYDGEQVIGGGIIIHSK